MAASGKRDLTQVIKENAQRLMAFIRKRVGSEADAEDILQDVFYQLAGNEEPIEQVTSWLYRVTRNKITDKQRKKKDSLIDDVFGNADEDGLQDWAELFHDRRNDPETDHLRSLFWDTLQMALDELPEPQRQVFVWNELEEVPFKEIAAMTGEPVNTLISRKRYAVLHLRERLSVLRQELFEH